MPHRREHAFDQVKLLLSEIEQMAAKKNLQYLPTTLQQAFPMSLSEAQVIEEVVKHLDERLPEDEEYDDESTDLQLGTVLLLDYLWASQGKSGASIAKKVPLLTSSLFTKLATPRGLQAARPTCVRVTIDPVTIGP
jgi:hypothetical protein